MEHNLGIPGSHSCLFVCFVVCLFCEDMMATTAVQEISQKPHQFAAAVVNLPFRLLHNCCSFLNRSWGFHCGGLLSSLRPPLSGSWAFGEVVAEDSLLCHMMSLSQFPAQTWKTTLWSLHTHIHTHMHEHTTTANWRSRLWLKCPSIGHYCWPCCPLCDLLCHDQSRESNGTCVCCALWLHYSSVGLTCWLWFLPHGFTLGQKSCCHLVERTE